jgi:hypothetical protein
VLEDDVRDYDRHFARSLPSVLARAGFRVYRLRTSLRLTLPVVTEKVLS